MNIFISWSGERSKKAGASLCELLNELSFGVSAWMSAHGIAAGKVWRNELFKKLRSAHIGIVCVSKSSIKSEWVQFETGALCTLLPDGHVFPYLVDLKDVEVPETMRSLQCCHATHDEAWGLIRTIYSIRHKEPPPDLLKERFSEKWGALQSFLSAPVTEHPRPLHKDDYNRLDRVGFQNIIKIHFVASARRTQRAVSQALANAGGKVSNLHPELLALSIANTLKEGRLLLAPFSHEKVTSINLILDKMLPGAELDARLKQGMDLALKCQNAVELMTMVEHLIQAQQSLLEEILSKTSFEDLDEWTNHTFSQSKGH